MPEYLYGRHSVREALRAGRRQIRRVILAQGLRPAPILQEIVQLAKAKGIALEERPKAALAQFARDHQGVVAEASTFPYAQFDIRALLRQSREPLLLALDLLQDPQNMGTLLRTAEATGVALVLLQERRQVGVTPAVSHSSAGAVEYLQVARVVNLARALKELQEAGFTVYGLERSPQSIEYCQAKLLGPLALVVGSEGAGLRRLVRERCQALLSLPMRGRVTSLNAAVAGSVVLFEALRQRKALDGN